jgi:TRAP-type C4-dicarboxylate transport system permease small subunit
MKVIKWLDDHLEETVLAILLVVITCVSFLQVVIRKIPWIPALTWAEEFCRFCWIWSVFLSLPYTIRKSSMLRVTALLDLLPHSIRQILNILVDLVTTVCMALLAFHSVAVVNSIRESSEMSPAMLWPMWIVYSVMLIGFGLAVLRGIQQTVLHILHFNDKGLSTVEQAMEEAKEETELAKGGND